MIGRRLVIITEAIRRDRSCRIGWTRPLPPWRAHIEMCVKRVWDRFIFAGDERSCNLRFLLPEPRAHAFIRDYRNWRGERCHAQEPSR